MIEIPITSNRYSRFNPCWKITNRKVIRAIMKDNKNVNIILLLIPLTFEKTGTRQKKDRIIYEKPNSSITMKIPYGLYCDNMSPNQAFRNYRMIAVDLPGHGESTKSQNPVNDYRFNALKNTIATFAGQLGIKELVLAGHSLGDHLCI